MCPRSCRWGSRPCSSLRGAPERPQLRAPNDQPLSCTWNKRLLKSLPCSETSTGGFQLGNKMCLSFSAISLDPAPPWPPPPGLGTGSLLLLAWPNPGSTGQPDCPQVFTPRLPPSVKHAQVLEISPILYPHRGWHLHPKAGEPQTRPHGQTLTAFKSTLHSTPTHCTPTPPPSCSYSSASYTPHSAPLLHPTLSLPGLPAPAFCLGSRPHLYLPHSSSLMPQDDLSKL